MNYKKHYDLLIDRGRNRNLEGYKETHHVLPRCLGGTDDPDNLVDLTAEEHFLAHQLLVKIYPQNKNLIYACHRMAYSKNGPMTNKMYGWLRKRFCDQVRSEGKKRVGSKNGSYGSSWYHDPVTLESKRYKRGEQPDNWIKGRIIRREKRKKICPNCNNTFTPKTDGQKVCCYKEKITAYTGREKELIYHLKQGKTVSQSLKEMGFKAYSNTKGGVGKWAKNIKDNLLPE